VEVDRYLLPEALLVVLPCLRQHIALLLLLLLLLLLVMLVVLVVLVLVLKLLVVECGGLLL
jgi:hypothetical protein